MKRLENVVKMLIEANLVGKGPKKTFKLVNKEISFKGALFTTNNDVNSEFVDLVVSELKDFAAIHRIFSLQQA